MRTRPRISWSELRDATVGIWGLGVEGGASDEETQMIGQWLDSRHSQVLSGDEYRTASSGNDSDFE